MITKPIVIVILIVVIAAIAWKYRPQLIAKWNNVVGA